MLSSLCSGLASLISTRQGDIRQPVSGAKYKTSKASRPLAIMGISYRLPFVARYSVSEN